MCLVTWMEITTTSNVLKNITARFGGDNQHHGPPKNGTQNSQCLSCTVETVRSFNGVILHTPVPNPKFNSKT